MALYLLLTSWYLVYRIVPHLEGNMHVFHLLEDGVPPKRVAILFIKELGLFKVFWYSYAKIVSPDPVLGLDFCNYSVLLL